MAATMGNGETYKPVKTILISQPKPERSPYFELEQKFGVTIDWRPFTHVEGYSAKEFRRQRVNFEEYTSVVFNSKNAIENFFRLAKEQRVKMSEETKYFCITEAVALYLQKFIVYRKRKVFTGERTITDLKSYLNKHKSNEKFLVPCPENGAKDIANFLTEGKFNFTEAPMYRTVASDLSDLKDITYDVLVFFNPQVIESLYSNFPDFKQNETRLAGWGQATVDAILKHDLTCNIQGPTPELTSMQMALEKYLLQSNKPKQDIA